MVGPRTLSGAAGGRLARAPPRYFSDRDMGYGQMRQGIQGHLRPLRGGSESVLSQSPAGEDIVSMRLRELDQEARFMSVRGRAFPQGPDASLGWAHSMPWMARTLDTTYRPAPSGPDLRNSPARPTRYYAGSQANLGGDCHGTITTFPRAQLLEVAGRQVETARQLCLEKLRKNTLRQSAINGDVLGAGSLLPTPADHLQGPIADIWRSALLDIESRALQEEWELRILGAPQGSMAGWRGFPGEERLSLLCHSRPDPQRSGFEGVDSLYTEAFLETPLAGVPLDFSEVADEREDESSEEGAWDVLASQEELETHRTRLASVHQLIQLMQSAQPTHLDQCSRDTGAAKSGSTPCDALCCAKATCDRAPTVDRFPAAAASCALLPLTPREALGLEALGIRARGSAGHRIPLFAPRGQQDSLSELGGLLETNGARGVFTTIEGVLRQLPAPVEHLQGSSGSQSEGSSEDEGKNREEAFFRGPQSDFSCHLEEGQCADEFPAGVLGFPGSFGPFRSSGPRGGGGQGHGGHAGGFRCGTSASASSTISTAPAAPSNTCDGRASRLRREALSPRIPLPVLALPLPEGYSATPLTPARSDAYIRRLLLSCMHGRISNKVISPLAPEECGGIIRRFFDELFRALLSAMHNHFSPLLFSPKKDYAHRDDIMGARVVIANEEKRRYQALCRGVDRRIHQLAWERAQKLNATKAALTRGRTVADLTRREQEEAKQRLESYAALLQKLRSASNSAMAGMGDTKKKLESLQTQCSRIQQYISSSLTPGLEKAQDDLKSLETQEAALRAQKLELSTQEAALAAERENIAKRRQHLAQSLETYAAEISHKRERQLQELALVLRQYEEVAPLAASAFAGLEAQLKELACVRAQAEALGAEKAALQKQLEELERGQPPHPGRTAR